jgi:hypothetical protein
LIKESQWISRKTPTHFIRKIKGIAMTMLFFLVTSSFHTHEPLPDAGLIIHFRAYVHGEPLQLNKKYKNPFGETFQISRFRFYVGKIVPVYADAAVKTNLSSLYHLIDFSDSSTTRIEIPVSSGACNGIQFLLGVDSIDQGRGAQTGALDPVKGMFWTWNSGYQSFKIEGVSPVSSQPAHIMAYHIGGYRSPYSTVWKIRINTIDDESFGITKENKIIVEVPVELDYFFDGPTPLHIRTVSSCTTPGEQARKISENFIGTFTGLTLISQP